MPEVPNTSGQAVVFAIFDGWDLSAAIANAISSTRKCTRKSIQASARHATHGERMNVGDSMSLVLDVPLPMGMASSTANDMDGRAESASVG